MNDTENTPTDLPKIAKYSNELYTGIHTQLLSRTAIGYVVQGIQYVHEGDHRHAIPAGNIFYLGVGPHYVETCPMNNLPFEQIVIYYTSAELQRMLLYLNTTYGLNLSDDCLYEQNEETHWAAMQASKAIRRFFDDLDHAICDEEFLQDTVAASLKMTELVYLIVSTNNTYLRHKLLLGIDSVREDFEQIMNNYVFKDVSIDELAVATNRSLTSFKKEFFQHYHMPPHRWFVRQRLARARLLLISTAQSIAGIGQTCLFSNTSHFIKLFRKEYAVTPAVYRSMYLQSQTPASPATQPAKEVVEVM